MSLRRLHPEQPDSFAFTEENLKRAKDIIAKYPEGRQASAVMPILDLAQRQEGWVTKPAIEVVAGMLGMAVIRVLEVATFYTMYRLEPVGKHHIQVCHSLPCLLRGSNDVFRACKDKLGIGAGQTTEDGNFTVDAVECAGACVNAPVAALGDDYVEDLDYDRTIKMIEALQAGQTADIGSTIGRVTSAPEGGPSSLTDDPTQKYPKQDLAAAKAAFEEKQKEKAN